MSAWRPFLLTVHLLALAVWLSATIGAGMGAAIMFPTMKELDPSLPAYSAYAEPHWRLAAGFPAERLFLVADLIKFPASIIALLAFAGEMLLRGRRPLASLVRALALGVALAAFAGQLFILGPSMNASLRSYREAAAAGAMELAANHQAAFNDQHPLASNLMAVSAVALLIAIAVAAWSAASRPPAAPNAAASSGLQEPALAKGRR